MIIAQSGNVHGQHNVVRPSVSFNFNERFLTMSITFLKDKETKSKIRYAASVGAAQQGVAGSLYIDKDSELAKESKIILEITKETT